MTTYTGFGSGAPSASYSGDADTYTMGTAFKVTSADMTLTKVRIYLSSNGGSVTAAQVSDAGTPLRFTLFAASSTLPGAGGSPLFTPIDIATATLDAWTEATLPVPFALTQDVIYYAAVYLPHGRYTYISHQFDADVTVGPITFPVTGSSQGGAGTVANGAFRSPTFGPPGNTSNNTWYGIDVEVSDGAGAATVDGTAASTLGATVATATGIRTVVAAATVALSRPVAVAVGGRTVFGVAPAVLGRVMAAGSAVRAVLASGSASVGAVTARGAVPSAVRDITVTASVRAGAWAATVARSAWAAVTRRS